MMCDQLRNKAIKALSTVFSNENNVKSIENYCYSKTKNETQYLEIIYEIIDERNNNKSISEIKQNIKDKKYIWNHNDFEQIIYLQKQKNKFIENPIDVEEGVLECFKCGSKKVYSYSKMTRSSDEPMSTFALCCLCGNHWVYSG